MVSNFTKSQKRSHILLLNWSRLPASKYLTIQQLLSTSWLIQGYIIFNATQALF